MAIILHFTLFLLCRSSMMESAAAPRSSLGLHSPLSHYHIVVTFLSHCFNTALTHLSRYGQPGKRLGPPFSVLQADVEALYGDAFTIEVLDSTDIPTDGRFTERDYLLTRRLNGKL